MEHRKVLAYRHSQEIDGKGERQEEVEILDSTNVNGTTIYLAKTQDGIHCMAIYNAFANTYFVDDIYGIVDDSRKRNGMEM